MGALETRTVVRGYLRLGKLILEVKVRKLGKNDIGRL